MPKGKTTCACGSGCHCGCGNGYGHGHHVILWIFGIVLLGIAFVIGVKVGEFRVELSNAYGGYYRGYPMMQNWGYGGAPVQVQGSATGTPTQLP